ncbi:MAG: class I SAM-dependent methyltransferase [Bryobacteraceae bacterium]
MGIKHGYLASEEIVRYVCAVSEPEHPVLAKCREETGKHPLWQMQIGAEQAAFFRILLAMLNAKKTLEVGVFTGYSSTLAALSLPADGRVVACDVSDEFTQTALRFWREAGVADKVELRLGPAADTLRALVQEGQAGTFDFAFIDADKTSYDTYYEYALELVRPRGLIVLDNTLRSGKVLDESSTDAEVIAVQKLNRKLAKDDRVLVSLLPLTDGTTLAWKKG